MKVFHLEKTITAFVKQSEEDQVFQKKKEGGNFQELPPLVVDIHSPQKMKNQNRVFFQE